MGVRGNEGWMIHTILRERPLEKMGVGGGGRGKWVEEVSKVREIKRGGRKEGGRKEGEKNKRERRKDGELKKSYTRDKIIGHTRK